MLPVRGTRKSYVPLFFRLWHRKDRTAFLAEPSFAPWKTKEDTSTTAIVLDVTLTSSTTTQTREKQRRIRYIFFLRTLKGETPS